MQILHNRNKIDVRHSTRDLRDRKIGRRICGVSGICPILNEVLQHDLKIPNNANRKSPDTPLSYPFLWDSPQHDKVQWNGSAPNRVL